VTAVMLAAGAVAGLAGVLAYQALAAEQTVQTRPGTVRPQVVAAAPEGAQDKGRVASVKEMPPVVVRTVPQAGDTQVDAAKTTEIRVTFSKEMMDENWSWIQVSEETFPKATGKPRYDKDRRTCVLPVKLEPGKTYVLWLNSAEFSNFKDTDQRSAIPYLLVFETKP
jgi:RNA polymerase sigma-70 factor (ECF subfamily)